MLLLHRGDCAAMVGSGFKLKDIRSQIIELKQEELAREGRDLEPFKGPCKDTVASIRKDLFPHQVRTPSRLSERRAEVSHEISPFFFDLTSGRS